MRPVVFWVSAALVFAALNGLIAQKEEVLRTGAVVLLELRPRDPRSLMQGDYMTLRYRVPFDVEREVAAGAGDGRLVLSLNPSGEARMLRVHRGEPLAPGEQLLRYRRRDGGLRLGAESFMFQEGHAARYAGARYGELRVTPAGDSVLVGLRSEAPPEVLDPRGR